MHQTMRRGLLLVGALAALSPAAGTALAAKPARTAVRGSHPSWAQSSRDRGAAAAGQTIDIHVYLPLRDSAAAESLVADVSTPGSANYGHFLSPQDFRSRFAPLASDVAAVKQFLTDAGLTVGDVPANNTSVAASGTVAQVANAFGVDVHKYAYRGKLLNAPTSELTIPASLQGKVIAVSGVDQSGVLIRPRSVTPRDDAAVQTPARDAPVQQPSAAQNKAGAGAPPPDAFVNAPPCSAYYGEKVANTYPKAYGRRVPFAVCGHTPDQFQGAYGTNDAIAGGLDGRGVTVAITDAYAAPTILHDANVYAGRHGQGNLNAQFSQILPTKPFRYGYDDRVNGDLCGEQGWYGEETLDVEAVHAMAPGANILYVAGRSCADGDLLDAINTIVDGNKANIITNSWGSLGEDEPPNLLKAYQQTFVQAALEGIGVFFSSGDDGDDSTDLGAPAVDFPASNPYVTAVGGTALGVGATGKRLFETGWTTGTTVLSADGKSWDPAPPGDWLYGGGGGVSSLYAEPAYQQGEVPDAIAQGHRALPDIALDGDPNTGMLIGETQTFPDGTARYSEYRLGGTSLSSPLMAGMEAIADQVYGRPHGFANPAIYDVVHHGGIRDVRQDGVRHAVVRIDYNNGVNGDDGTTAKLRTLDDEAQSLHLGDGWDNLTGVGTPNGMKFLTQLGYTG